jgi:hypothetical protein
MRERKVFEKEEAVSREQNGEIEYAIINKHTDQIKWMKEGLCKAYFWHEGQNWEYVAQIEEEKAEPETEEKKPTRRRRRISKKDS